MAFAGHVGVSLNVDLLVTEGDGITDSRADYGDAKNWAAQVGPRREELTLKALFSEELGVLLQVRTAERNEVMQVLREHGLSKLQPFRRQDPARPSSIDVGKGEVQVWRDTKAVFSAKLRRPAPGVGQRELEDLPATRQPRRRRHRTCGGGRPRRSGLACRPGASTRPRTWRRRSCTSRASQGRDPARAGRQLPRRDGLHLHRSRLRRLRRAHDRPADRPRAGSTDFKGFVACGGFSYGDTLGAGIGWARSITFNARLADQFKAFFDRPDTFALGRLQRLPDAGRTGRHHSRCRRPGRASRPTAASATRLACRRWKCWSRPACSSPAWRAAACRSRWRTARATPTSRTAATRRKVIARDALHGQPRPGRPRPIRSIRTAAPAA